MNIPIKDHRDEEIARLKAENEALREALTPSGETKAAYIGEFSFQELVTCFDEDLEDFIEESRTTFVPWTTVKEIMAAIRTRAALEGKGND